MFKHGATRNIRIRDLASFILDHSDVKKSSQTLLGRVYNVYRLKIQGIILKLETKGQYDDYILELHAYEDGVKLFSYKAYEEEQSEKDKHTLPEYVYVHLTQY